MLAIGGGPGPWPVIVTGGQWIVETSVYSPLRGSKTDIVHSFIVYINDAVLFGKKDDSVGNVSLKFCRIGANLIKK